MAEYIEREALLEKMKNWHEKISLVACVNSMPAADVVPVVRCKDCTEWDELSGECSHWYGFRENDYCSFAEIKDV